MNTKAQGDIGVAMAVAYYTSNNYPVSIPLGDNCRYDLVVEIEGVLKRIQCKTSNSVEKNYYRVQLRTNGGNHTGRGKSKNISAKEVDLLFVFAFDGTLYEFPPHIFDNKTNLSLGPSKEPFKVGYYPIPSGRK